MILLMVALGLFDYKRYDWLNNTEFATNYVQAFDCIIVVINTLILAFAVIKIRKLL